MSNTAPSGREADPGRSCLVPPGPRRDEAWIVRSRLAPAPGSPDLKTTDVPAAGRNFLLYDFMQVAGGAERVTLTLAEALPSYTTVVSRIYPECAPLLEGRQVEIAARGNAYSRWLGRIPEAILNFRYRSRFLAAAGTVVYSGYYAPLAARFQGSGRRIYYCHALPRFAYDLIDHYRPRFPAGTRWAYDLAMAWLRREYRLAVTSMDVVVANSENVRRRLREYLGLDARVIHPPVATERFHYLDDQGYYLSVARLTGNKRVHIIVEAFLRMPHRQLVVVSGGPELSRLQQLAAGAGNIRFVGWQSEEALRAWVGNARAAIYVSIDEDFGMSPVEAMAAGKPVIGVAAGGLLETVVDGQTGVLIEEPLTVEGLVAAVDRLEGLDPAAMRAACERRAGLFSEAAFLDKMRALLGESAN